MCEKLAETDVSVAFFCRPFMLGTNITISQNSFRKSLHVHGLHSNGENDKLSLLKKSKFSTFC